MKADEIKTIRKLLGLTAKEFADAIGTTENTVYRWEMGIRNPSGMACKAMQKLIDEHLAKAEQSVPA